jgi:hypothetical protein
VDAGGLRTYADVVAWIRNPVVFALDLAVPPSCTASGCCT